MDPIVSTAAKAPPAPAAPQRPNPAASAAESARDFEAVFLAQVAGMMMETVETGGEFSGGHAEVVFRGILAERLGSEMAKSGGIGLAPIVMDQLIRLQGNHNGQ